MRSSQRRGLGSRRQYGVHLLPSLVLAAGQPLSLTAAKPGGGEGLENRLAHVTSTILKLNSNNLRITLEFIMLTVLILLQLISIELTRSFYI